MKKPKISIISEILQKTSLSDEGLAEMLDITTNYLYRLDKGTKKPSFELLEKLASLSEVSVGTLVDAFYDSNSSEAASALYGIRTHLDALNKLRKERNRCLDLEQRNSDLEELIEHMEMLLKLYMVLAEIFVSDTLTKKDKMQQIEIVAKTVVPMDEFAFDEMLTAFKVTRPQLKAWLDEEKKVFKCKHIPGNEVMATSPGEAALRLRCSDCENYCSKKCEGYGNMKSPDNIIALLAQLEAKGIYKRDEQAELLDESYGMRNMSAHQISEILHRNKSGKKIPEGAFYLEASEGNA